MIGGEFDIDVQRVQSQWPNNILANDVSTYSTGRAALYHIIKHAMEHHAVSQIMVPDYLCSSVLVPIQKLGFNPVFYPINDQLEMKQEEFAQLYKKGSLVIIINYFGLMDITAQVNYVRELDEHAVVVEDDVQAYYEFEKPLGCLDARFTSLRKWFALPDGGLVKSRIPDMLTVVEPNTFHQYKVAGSILKTLRNPDYYDDRIYLDLFEKGEDLIDADIEKGMSNITREHIKYSNTERISYMRTRNAQYLIDGLKKLNIAPILPLTEGKTPLFVPIWLEDRNKVRRAMFQQDVFCPVHWPLEGMPVKKGAEMAEHELSLIVDQRYTTKDMDLILNIISDNI